MFTYRSSRTYDRYFCMVQAIHGYRESEKSDWSQENQRVLSRLRQHAFDDPEQSLVHVHVLDLAKDGYIKPHIDSIRVCFIYLCLQSISIGLF
jgi:hypothetical protein